MMNKKPTVFISYNQKSGDAIADQIQNRLASIACIVRDKTSIPDWGSIKAFMKSIRSQDLVVMIITAEYLESFGCMFEVAEVMKDDSWNKHTMFVVSDGITDIYNSRNLRVNEYSSGTEDLEEIPYSQQTVEQGDREELYCLGRRYETGEGGERDYEKAESYYRQAAELGHIRAQCCLGYMYEQGIGVKCNGEKATYWFREAAEQGDAAAQYLLGKRIFKQSMGNEGQYLKAAEWYQKVAEQEYIPAQSALSKMYASGKGVKQDYEKAVYWFQKSYQQSTNPTVCRAGKP